jgi:Sulphur transport
MLFLLAFIFSFCMGLAIQRGGVCTVAAVHELIYKKTANRVKALVETALWVLIGEWTLVRVGIHLPDIHIIQITAITFLGAFLLGCGAVINGACAVGTIARIGNGEWDFFAFIPGFLLGAAFVSSLELQSLLPITVGTQTTPIIDSWLMATCLVLILIRGYFLFKRGFHPYVLTIFIGVFFLGLIAIDRSWSYTDLLVDLAMLQNQNLVSRICLFIALLAGAIISGHYQNPKNQSMHPLSPSPIKRFSGGAIIGGATLILPGSHDSLILLYMPMLLGYAWLGFVVMIMTITTLKFIAKNHLQKKVG